MANPSQSRRGRQWPGHAYPGVALILALSQASCGLEGLGITRCPAGLLPGELVITEIMANPGNAGPATEWIEIHNPTETSIDLENVILQVSHADGSSKRSHVMDSIAIAPGEYLVLGSDPRGASPAHYSYGQDLGELPDADGRVALRCDVIEVDAVVYPIMPASAALGLSSDMAPDHEINDDPARWCPASQYFAPGLAGSPGQANEPCAGTPGAGCEQDGARRDLVVPAIGDLVITEILADPAAAPDATGEWIELYVARDVDLNGLAVGRDLTEPRSVLDGSACLRATAGSYLVLAASTDPALNGGLPAVDHVLALGLTNSSSSVSIGLGSTVLDQVTWSSSRPGAALSLDPGQLSPADNDAATSWCLNTQAPYGQGDSGTPGTANPTCTQAMPGSMCRDGAALRPVLLPGPGQLVITEYMPDPAGVADASGEWIELRIDTDADLNGLALGNEPGVVRTVIQAEDCLRARAGTHVVLARNADPAQNGGLPRVDAVLGNLGLANSGGGLFVSAADEVLDAVSYAGSTTGVATSLDESDGMTWCPSTAASYGSGGRGSPGAANPACPPAAARLE